MGMQQVNTLSEGKTLGVNAGFSVCYFPSTWFSVGVNADFMYARLTKIDRSTKKITERIKFEEKDYEYLTRFNYSFCLRFLF